jgi:hypothetical protein
MLWVTIRRGQLLGTATIFGSIQESAGRFGIQGRRVLVEQQHFRFDQRGHEHGKACRWPPESSPTDALRRSSRPRPRICSCSLKNTRSPRLTPIAQSSPLPPLARQGHILLDAEGGAGPHQRILKHPADIGGPPVLRPERDIAPPDEHAALHPADAPRPRPLSNVDLPAPLDPIRVTKSPLARCNSI